MAVNKMAGLMLILFGIINVLHEISLRPMNVHARFTNAFVTSAFIASGALSWSTRGKQK